MTNLLHIAVWKAWEFHAKTKENIYLPAFLLPKVGNLQGQDGRALQLSCSDLATTAKNAGSLLSSLGLRVFLRVTCFLIVCMVAKTSTVPCHREFYCSVVLCGKHTGAVVLILLAASLIWLLVCKGGGVGMSCICMWCLCLEVNGFSTQRFDTFKRGMQVPFRSC